jgi:hypothetical protein
MLFDLRSRGRRRAIQVVYGGLAVLIGGGLVLFGVGSGAGGTGVLSQLAQNGGGGSASGLKIYTTEVTSTGRAARAAPHDAAAWDRYAVALFRLASTNYVSTTTEAGYTPAGAKQLAVLDKAWNHYLSLSPAKPDVHLAADVAAAFGGSGIQEYSIAEGAQEIVTTSEPKNYIAWTALAEDAYLAGQAAPGKLAEAKAVKLAPKSQKTAVQAAITDAQLKAAATSGTSSTTPTGTTAATGTSGATN